MKIPRRRTSPLGAPTPEERSRNLRNRLYAAASHYMGNDPIDPEEQSSQERELHSLAERIAELYYSDPSCGKLR